MSVEDGDFEVFTLAEAIDMLPPEAIEKGKLKEIGNMDDFKVYRWMPVRDLPEGADVKDTVWVIANEGREARCHFCYRNLATDEKSGVCTERDASILLVAPASISSGSRASQSTD